MLTDDDLERIGAQGEWIDYRMVPMARELLARRNVMRCEDELTRIELAGEVDPVDAWDALEKARKELDEVTR